MSEPTRRAGRDGIAAAAALEVRGIASTDANLLPALREALGSGCTIGEICGSLASFGVHMTPSMRSRRTRIALALAPIPAAIPFAAVAMSGRTPSFTRDVAPIIADKCAGCHQTGGIAPFPLETSKQISAHAGRIGGAQARVMPPWPPGSRSPTRDKRREP